MFFKEVVRRVFQLFSDEGSPLFELEVKQLMAGKKQKAVKGDPKPVPKKEAAPKAEPKKAVAKKAAAKDPEQVVAKGKKGAGNKKLSPAELKKELAAMAGAEEEEERRPGWTTLLNPHTIRSHQASTRLRWIRACGVGWSRPRSSVLQEPEEDQGSEEDPDSDTGSIG
jgi:hypothetical protein